MPLEADFFTSFVASLKNEKMINDDEIEKSLEYLDGIEGVLSDKFFIFGYENIGWFLSKNSSLKELTQFVTNNKEFLLEDSGSRYFFTQALVDNPEFSPKEKDDLIDCMPDRYQVFLRKRFLVG